MKKSFDATLNNNQSHFSLTLLVRFCQVSAVYSALLGSFLRTTPKSPPPFRRVGWYLKPVPLCRAAKEIGQRPPRSTNLKPQLAGN